MCDPLRLHLLAEGQHEIVLFCLGHGTKQSTEIYDGRKGTRLNHGSEELNSIIFFDISNPISQPLSVREVSVASAQTRKVSFAV